jgi:Family of unknown function (DUF5519)
MCELRKALIEEFIAIGITEKLWPDRDDGFSSLLYKNKDFAHFHNDNELDLRLTAKIIKAQGVLRPNNSSYHPDRSNNSPWIEVRFTTPADLPEVIRLVKLAIAQI